MKFTIPKIIKEEWAVLSIGLIIFITLNVLLFSFSTPLETTNAPGEKKLTRASMMQTMQEYGIPKKEASYIYMVCSNEPSSDWCVMLWTHVQWHETKSGTEGVGRPPQNNLPGLKPCGTNGNGVMICRHPSYPNRMASFEDWIPRYSKFWYKNNCMEMITKSNYTPHDTGDWINNCEWMVNNFYN